jgi:hypothetical protein
MVKSHRLRIQRVPLKIAFYLLFLLCFFCPKLWASQDAMVLADRAVIYSDREMTSPIGYVSRGKKLVVGEIPRNKAQVYPIVVSGKVAYIRVIDVTTERESMDSTRLTAERFQKNAAPKLEGKFSASYFAFNSTIELDDATEDDSFFWHGISLKGEMFLKNRFDFQVVLNWMQTQEKAVKFRAFEIGPGMAYRLIDTRRFLLRLEAQALLIPYSSYSQGSEFRVNSYGYTLGGGLTSTILFDENWGMDLSAGLYRTGMFSFKAPEPYGNIDPVFTGLRMGIGINYTY